MKKFASYVVIFVLGFLVCAGVLYKYYGPPGQNNGQNAMQNMSIRPAPPIVVNGKNPIAAAAAKVGKSVVNIDTLGRAQPSGLPFGLFGLPFDPQPVLPRGKASGVIISPDGYILTNNHVVRNTQSQTVTLWNGKRLPARIIGVDPNTDLAVIKVDARNLPAAQFADSSSLAVGDWVIAIGNALGWEATVTVGVVSATKRTLQIDNKVLEDLIQTDAAINQGNSGGALADINGEIVGINTAIASTSPGGGSIGIGFAIPSSAAKRISNQLILKGRVITPWIGIGYDLVTDELREAFAAQGPRPPKGGAIITQIAPGGPADRAGVRRYDIILEINRKPVNNPKTIQDEILRRKIGQKVMLLIWRGGETRLVTVTTGERPPELG
ncbi:MAG: trypsin-like peptidase domain-containing protein [Armatimonadota bacterium]|nr:trypsin-like peptidase domain-containing protein [Armatimonadota bacterium]